MAYLGSWKIDDYITFYANTHTAATGAATDADAVPSYRVYEDETGATITTGNMALLDAANTVGFYSERLQLLTATGFEKGKQYVIYKSATVDSIVGTMSDTFQIEAEVDANTVSGSLGAVASVTGNVGGNVTGSVGSVVGAVGSVTGAVGSVTGNVGGNVVGSVASVGATVDANLTEIGGVAQSATDLKDFADAGYDPATNKVEGVKLVDTTTTNTDMVGTDGAALATVCTEARLAELDAANLPTVVDTIAGDVENIDGAAMRGTDGANTTTPPTAASIVDEWETQSQADPTGFHVNAMEIESVDATNQIRDAVVDDATRLDGTAINTLAGYAPASVIAAASDVSAVDTRTQDIQSRLPVALVTGRMASDAVAISGSTTAADSVEANIANLDAAVSATATPAEVNAEVLDVLNVDTFAEPGQGAPAATTTIFAKINYLYKFLRNKITLVKSTGVLSVFSDDGITIDHKTTVTDDDATYTRPEIGSGA